LQSKPARKVANPILQVEPNDCIVFLRFPNDGLADQKHLAELEKLIDKFKKIGPLAEKEYLFHPINSKDSNEWGFQFRYKKSTDAAKAKKVIYKIIWLSLLDGLFGSLLRPNQPRPPNFRRPNPNGMWNLEIQKKLGFFF
jgi:hypothetical protein